LLADDDLGIREALRDLLTDEGCEIVGMAASGEEAAALAAATDPDVILMDLRMPGVDGIEATRRIRERDSLVQVVILSAYDDEALTISADEAGAYTYLVKGCSAALVRDVILKAWALKKGLEARGDQEGLTGA
jgi:DNA-binding NarL/FixJ family response regulator